MVWIVYSCISASLSLNVFPSPHKPAVTPVSASNCAAEMDVSRREEVDVLRAFRSYTQESNMHFFTPLRLQISKIKICFI